MENMKKIRALAVLLITSYCCYAQNPETFSGTFTEGLHELCKPGQVVVSPTLQDNLNVSGSANVVVRSATGITLKPGFSAGGWTSGGGFTAKIDEQCSDEICGFDAVLRRMMEANPNLQELINSQNEAIRIYIEQNESLLGGFPPTFLIPVVVHDLSGSGISYNQIQWQINALNAAFASPDDYPTYNQQIPGQFAVNTNIQFCLAQNTTPNTLPWSNLGEPGIMRYPIFGAANDDGSSNAALTNITHPTGAGRFPFDMYLNIWLVNGFVNPTNGLPSGVIGYGAFPPNPPFPLPAFDGIVFRADCFGDNTPGNNFPLNVNLDQGKILAHEAGHYLGLFHTFQPDVGNLPACAGTTGFSNTPNHPTACNQRGDLCCDTPPTNYATQACISPQNTCDETYFALPLTNHIDMLENYMSYSDDDCMNTFTNDQSQRMSVFLLNNAARLNLWQPANLNLTGVLGPNACANCVFSANIDYTPQQVCVGMPIQFTNAVTSSTCPVNIWQWNFGDPASGVNNFSNLQDPVHIFVTPGNHTVTLMVSDGITNAIQNVQVQVSNCSLPGNFVEAYNSPATGECGLDYVQQSVRLNQRVNGNTNQTPNPPPNTNFVFNNIPQNAILERAFMWFTSVGPANGQNPMQYTFRMPSQLLTNSCNPDFVRNVPVLQRTNDDNGTCWGSVSASQNNTSVYFDDLTELFTSVNNLNGTYNIQNIVGITAGSFDISGATLMLIYKTPCTNTTRRSRLVIWHGLDIHAGVPQTISYPMVGLGAFASNTSERAFMVVADVETNNTAMFDINQVLPSTSGMFPFMTGNPSSIMHTYNELTAASGELPVFLPNQGTVTYRVDQNGINTTNQDCFAVAVMGAYVQDADNTHTCTPISVIAAPIDDCNVNGTVTLNSTPTGGAQPVTFEWSPAANITGSVATQNTTGTASNEIVDFSITATGADGCKAKDDVVVAHCEHPAMVYQICNTTSTTFLATLNDPPGNVVTANGPILINGLFTIDHDINFENCHQIELSPNARIVVVPGSTLTFKNCRLSTCQDYMWDGIYLSQANGQVSRLYAGASEFEHAINAVVSDGGGDYQITDCIFRDCHIGIRVQNYNPSSNVPHPSNVSSSTFIQSNPLLPPFCGEKYFAGIDVYYVDDLTIEGENLFDNLQYGIRACRSDVTVINNTFQHIYINPNVIPPYPSFTPTPSPPLAEGAVVAWTPFNFLGSVIDDKIRVLGDPSNNTHNTFIDCHYGVYALMQHAEISNGNTFDNVRNGVWLIESDNAQVGSATTGGNIFTNTNYGTAIRIDEGFGLNLQEQVYNNTITNNNTGIFITNTGESRVQNNSISFAVNATQNGIAVNGCRSPIIHTNSINHINTPNLFVGASRLGIYSEGCSMPTITHNMLTRMGRGISMRGSNIGSVLACNNIVSCFDGFRFTAANIGHQVIMPGSSSLRPTDNTWSQMVNGGRRMRGNVIPWVVWVWRPTIQLFNPTLSFTSAGLLYWQSNTTSPCPYTPQIQEPPTPETRSLLFEYSVMDTADMGDYAEGLRYYQKEAVYRSFREDTTWLYLDTADDGLYQNYYNSLRNSNFEKFITSMEKAVSGKADEAIAINNSISPQNIIEQNRKTVNDILFHTWAKDSLLLSDEYYQTLHTIAFLHPITNGPGVYTARVILGLEIIDDYDGSDKTDDIPMPVAEEIQFTKIYPNPNSGQMQMDYLLPESNSGVLEIIDFNGRVLQVYKLTEGIHTIAININEYTQGVYFARVYVNGEYKYSEKIVVIE